MTIELKEHIEKLISYYGYHSVDQFVNGSNPQLKNFVVDDFTKLLTALEEELVK